MLLKLHVTSMGNMKNYEILINNEIGKGRGR